MLFERIKLVIISLAFTFYGGILIFRTMPKIFYNSLLEYSRFKEIAINKNVSSVYLLGNKSWLFERVLRRTRFGTRYYNARMWETIIEDKNDFEHFCEEHGIQIITNPSFRDTYSYLIINTIELLSGMMVLIFGIVKLISLILSLK